MLQGWSHFRSRSVGGEAEENIGETGVWQSTKVKLRDAGCILRNGQSYAAKKTSILIHIRRRVYCEEGLGI